MIEIDQPIPTDLREYLEQAQAAADAAMRAVEETLREIRKIMAELFFAILREREGEGTEVASESPMRAHEWEPSPGRRAREPPSHTHRHRTSVLLLDNPTPFA